MTLDDIRSILGELCTAEGGAQPSRIGRVVRDSRSVLPGDVFVAISGAKFDGHDFTGDAARQRAAVIVHEKELSAYSEKVHYMRVSDCSRAYALLMHAQCEYPDRHLKLLGVTGTNGKTTTAFLLEHLLNHAGRRCGLLSTIEYRDGKVARPASHTTPGADVLYPLLQTMQRNGMEFVAMELSSHALAQSRAAGAQFRTAIFTNLTGDHLDYHHDMESYYQSKKRLFTELLAPAGSAVINIDDPWGRRLAGEITGRKIIRFGADGAADWRIENVELASGGTHFRLSGAAQCFEIGTPLIGMHNVSNLAGAILTLLDCGIGFAELDAALKYEFFVPGRLERFRLPCGAAAFVDFAHTDDALRHVLATLKPMTQGRLIAVFGAGGDRDRTKRPRMGAAAAESADLLIVTSDNPRSEDPGAIIAEITAGIPAGHTVETIPDRRAAICHAVELAQPGDIVLIAGKGHENYQEIQGVKRPFSDAGVLHELGAVRE